MRRQRLSCCQDGYNNFDVGLKGYWYINGNDVGQVYNCSYCGKLLPLPQTQEALKRKNILDLEAASVQNANESNGFIASLLCEEFDLVDDEYDGFDCMEALENYIGVIGPTNITSRQQELVEAYRHSCKLWELLVKVCRDITDVG